MRTASEKIIPVEQVSSVVSSLRAKDLRIVTTNGCFDVLHLGHLRYLENARHLGDRLWVAVNSDDSVRRLKGASRPLNPLEARLFQLAALECVDYVTFFDEDTPLSILERIRPEVHVKGGDYRPDDLPETATVRKHGGHVVCLPFVQGYSTTSFIEKISKSFPEK